MKKLLLFLSLMAITTVNAQQANYKVAPSELVAENNVFEVSGKNSSELYQLTKKWIASKYENPNKIIVFDNENTSIGIKHFFDIDTEYTSPRKVKVKYNLSLDFKDEKVRVTFTNIGDTSYTKYSAFFDKKGNRRKYNDKAISTLEEYASKFVDDYVSYLQKGNDW